MSNDESLIVIGGITYNTNDENDLVKLGKIRRRRPELFPDCSPLPLKRTMRVSGPNCEIWYDDESSIEVEYRTKGYL